MLTLFPGPKFSRQSITVAHTTSLYNCRCSTNMPHKCISINTMLLRAITMHSGLDHNPSFVGNHMKKDQTNKRTHCMDTKIPWGKAISLWLRPSSDDFWQSIKNGPWFNGGNNCLNILTNRQRTTFLLDPSVLLICLLIVMLILWHSIVKLMPIWEWSVLKRMLAS